MGDDLATALSALPVFDGPGTLKRVRGCAELVGELLELLTFEVPRLSGEISTHIDGKDPEKLRQAAHALKGTCASAGAERLREIAGRLEHGAPAGNFVEAAGLLIAINDEWGNLESFIASFDPESLNT